MAKIETTGGQVTITIDNCNCGLTGGCWKCRPIILSKPLNYDNRLTLIPAITFTPSLINLYGLTEKALEDIREDRVRKVPCIRQVKG